MRSVDLGFITTCIIVIQVVGLKITKILRKSAKYLNIDSYIEVSPPHGLQLSSY